MTADPNTAEEYAAAGAAASRQLRYALGDAAGRNKRVVVYADTLRTVLDDYDTLAEAWDAEQDNKQARAEEESLGKEHRACAHCSRDLTSASIHKIQGIDVCADIRTCLARQARFAERIAALGPVGCGPQCSEMHTYAPGQCEAAVVNAENGMADDVQQAEVKRTPDEWCSKYLIQVHDPDGWRDPDAPAWEEPITLADFYRRVRRSTLRNVVSVDWEGLARDAEESER